MEKERIQRDAEFKSRAQLVAELETMHRRLAELESIEARCQRAEAALRALEERNRVLKEAAPMGIFAVDEEGQVITINSKMLAMFSLSPLLDVRTINIFRIPELVGSGIAGHIRRCLARRESVVFDDQLPRSSGKFASLRYHLSPVIDADGVAIGVMAFAEEVDELKRVEQALRDSEKSYRMLFHSAPVAMIERDASELKAYIERLRASGIEDFEEYLVRHPEELGRCLSMIKTLDYNGAFVELMELESGQGLENGFGMADPQRVAEVARDIVRVVAEGRVSNEAERVFVTLKGNKKSVLSKFLAISGHEETLSRVVIALVDISQRKQAEEALQASEQKFRDQAMRDELTGLYNRRYLYRSLTRLIESGNGTDAPVSIIFMDIDHFKMVVDTYGHLNGSQAIREVAATIQDCVENPAYAVAYAGDEFVVVLPGCSTAQARQKALEIQDRMQRTVYLRQQGFEVGLQASFGIAGFPDHASNLTTLLARADQTLFAVKQCGKNAICCFGEEAFPTQE